MSADEPTDYPAGEPVDTGDDAAVGGAPAADADGDSGARARPSYGPVIALGLAAAVAIGAIVVALVGGDAVSATAVRVDSSEVSQKTFNGQLRELAPVLRDEGAPPSSVTNAFLPSRTAAQLAQLYVYRDVVAGRVAVNAADRRQALDQLGKNADVLGSRFRRLVVDVTALQTKLVNDRGTNGSQRFFARLARRADIHVDPRYGFWNPARGRSARPRAAPPPRQARSAMPGRVTVVGLGPAGADHLLPAALTALQGADRRFVRTRRHPAVTDLEATGMQLASFDDIYDSSPDLETAYARIADVVMSAAATARVAYAVPGSPAVAERTVELLRARASHGAVRVDVVPGLSFADLAWARLGVDPMRGDARVVDARAIDDAELAGELLIAQCDHALVLSDVKLALLEHLAPDTEVTVLQRLGLRDEHVVTVALAELDHDVEPDHLTSLFVDAGATGAAHEMVRLFQLAKRLRDPGGCPWDAEQTHHSLTRYLLEESYEVVEAVEALPIDAPQGGQRASDDAYAALADELGDLLYQVVFHALLAEEADAFTMADVARGVHDKLVRRHPHVFGDVVADDIPEVMRNWEQIKKEEKGTESLVDGITPGLPSLLYTNKLFRKAASIGLDPGGLHEALDRVDLAVRRMREHDADLEADLAQLLAAGVVVARAGGVDAESALRGWAARYRDRFAAMERLAADRGIDLAAVGVDQVAALWLEASAGPRQST